MAFLKLHKDSGSKRRIPTGPANWTQAGNRSTLTWKRVYDVKDAQHLTVPRTQLNMCLETLDAVFSQPTVCGVLEKSGRQPRTRRLAAEEQ